MINNRFDAQAVGVRIRNARNAKGWTLAELAEKAETTSQNISKYEKNGVSDMNWISILSSLLDTNLLEDAIDLEGSVTEIGKEILFQLVVHRGHCEMYQLEEFYMYGLSESQISNEIFKLAKIGLVVREKYLYYDDEEIDEVFVTAKGIITLKNMQLNMTQAVAFDQAFKPKMIEDDLGYERESYDDVTKSYEDIIRPYNCYSDLIEAHKVNDIEMILRKLPVVSDKEGALPYHSFFIDYLKRMYQDGYKREYEWLKIPFSINSNFYQILLSRMIYGISDSKIKELHNESVRTEKGMRLIDKFGETSNPLYDDNEMSIDCEYEEWADICSYTDDDNRYKEIFGDYYRSGLPDGFDDDLRKFQLKYGIDTSDLGLVFNINFQSILSKLETPEEVEYFKLLSELWHEWGPEANIAHESIEDLYSIDKVYSVMQDRKVHYVSEIYSDDEIRNFINDTFPAAVKDYEKEIDEKLKKVAEIKPEILDFFSFPKSWETNGLADLVRKNSGLF